MFAVIVWLALSVLIGIWASKLGREGIVWGLLAAFISPLLAAICLLIVGESNKDVQSDEKLLKNNSISSERDKEWEIVKKYVPEVTASLETILSQLNNKGISSAEEKLKELFFVIGKDGLTKEALNIIVTDVRREIEENERFEAQNSVKHSAELSASINMELSENLKNNEKVGFNSKFNLCEICNASKTGQTIDSHYVCGNCRQSYL